MRIGIIWVGYVTFFDDDSFGVQLATLIVEACFKIVMYNFIFFLGCVTCFTVESLYL